MSQQQPQPFPRRLPPPKSPMTEHQGSLPASSHGDGRTGHRDLSVDVSYSGSYDVKMAYKGSMSVTSTALPSELHDDLGHSVCVSSPLSTSATTIETTPETTHPGSVVTTSLLSPSWTAVRYSQLNDAALTASTRLQSCRTEGLYESTATTSFWIDTTACETTNNGSTTVSKSVAMSTTNGNVPGLDIQAQIQAVAQSQATQATANSRKSLPPPAKSRGLPPPTMASVQARARVKPSPGHSACSEAEKLVAAPAPTVSPEKERST